MHPIVFSLAMNFPNTRQDVAQKTFNPNTMHEPRTRLSYYNQRRFVRRPSPIFQPR